MMGYIALGTIGLIVLVLLIRRKNNNSFNSNFSLQDKLKSIKSACCSKLTGRKYGI